MHEYIQHTVGKRIQVPHAVVYCEGGKRYRTIKLTLSIMEAPHFGITWVKICGYVVKVFYIRVFDDGFMVVINKFSI